MATATKSSQTPALEWLQAGEPVAGSWYWLCGPEELLREQVLRRLREQVLDPGFAEFNHQVLRLSGSTRLGTLVDALSELPMMTERRLLELQNLHEIAPKVGDELARLMGSERFHPGLVVVAVSENPKGKSSFWDILRQRARVLQCDIDPKARGEFVDYCCLRRNLKLDSGQRQRVVERTGGNLRLIEGAIERLSVFAGDQKSVSDAELDRLVHDSSEVQTWKLTAAIGKRQLNEAYEVLGRLLQSEAPQSLLSYMNSYLLGLVQVAELRPRLKTAAAIAKEIPRRTEFQIRKSLEELDTWAESDLANAFERLAKADYRMKTGADPVLMMQLLVLQLVHRQAGRRR